MKTIEDIYEYINSIFCTDEYIDESNGTKEFSVYADGNYTDFYRIIMTELFNKGVDFTKFNCEMVKDIEQDDWFIIIRELGPKSI